MTVKGETVKKAIFILAVSIAAVSCSRNEINEYHVPMDIMFNAVARPNTKAADTGFPADGSFGVWAYSLEGDQRWETDSEKAEVAIAGEKVLRTENGLWKPSGGQQWLSPSITMNFFALSPFGRGGYNYEDGIVFNDYELSEGKDLMFVDGVTDVDKKSSQGVITLSFERALAKLSFNVQSSLPEGFSARVRSLAIREVYSAGDFRSRPSPHWIPKKEKTEIGIFQGERLANEYPEQLGDAVFVIPQIGDVEIILICDIIGKDTELLNQRLSKTIPIRWNIGKYSSYNLKITRNLELNAENPLGGIL